MVLGMISLLRMGLHGSWYDKPSAHDGEGIVYDVIQQGRCGKGW